MDNNIPEQQQQQQGQLPQFPSAPKDAMGGAMILLTDPESELRNFELYLKGLKQVGKRIVQTGQPLCNQEGTTQILGLAQGVANKNFELGHHEKEEFNNILMFNLDNIIRLLLVRKKDFGIQDDAARTSIFTAYADLVYSCLNRGKEGGERSFWKGTVLELRQQKINSDGTQEQHSGGIFGKLFKK